MYSNELLKPYLIIAIRNIMKHYLKPVICSIFIFMNLTDTSGQAFTKSRQSVILPSQILPENYSMIQLPEEKGGDPSLNRYDNGNPYTYLQLITDRSGKIFHILFQTDFLGKITLLAYSNSLYGVFNNREKPIFRFHSCIKNINRYVFSVQNAEAAINCILERLNYCSE